MTNNQIKRNKLYKAQNEAFLMSQHDDILREHFLAQKYGISKSMRQYAKRYGGCDVLEIVSTHRRNAVCPVILKNLDLQNNANMQEHKKQ